jgi:hypothetical protein
MASGDVQVDAKAPGRGEPSGMGYHRGRCALQRGKRVCFDHVGPDYREFETACKRPKGQRVVSTGEGVCAAGRFCDDGRPILMIDPADCRARKDLDALNALADKDDFLDALFRLIEGQLHKAIGHSETSPRLSSL